MSNSSQFYQKVKVTRVPTINANKTVKQRPNAKRTLFCYPPSSSDLGEAVGSKVDRRSSPHNVSYSRHQVVARREARQGRIASQPLARARTIKK